MAGLRERLLVLLEPVVEGLGYELVELEHKGTLLRVYIDRRAPAEGGVTVEDCEKASKAVSATLDASDPIPGHYTLEVSSPGFDRPLRKPEHFLAHAGKRAKLELATPLDGRRRFTGTLLGLDGEAVVMEVDGQTFRIPQGALERARLVG
jgi:ribosome maturation factor RimP